MSLTDIEAVRLRSSDRSVITREEGLGNGADVYFKLSHQSVLSSPDLQIRVNNVLVVAGYTVDYANGIVTFDTAPIVSAVIEFTYYWSVFTDDQIQYFLDAASGDVTVATAQVLLAIAADASKVAQRQSLAGGGGLGAVTFDSSVASRELRNTAQALLDMAQQVNSTTPADGLTEVIWNEFSYQEMIDQRIIRQDPGNS